MILTKAALLPGLDVRDYDLVYVLFSCNLTLLSLRTRVPSYRTANKQPSTVSTTAPTTAATAAPSVAETLYIPNEIVAVIVVLGIFVLCGVLCCLCTSAEGKRKIYEMMEEAKLEVDKADLVVDDDESGDEDDDATADGTMFS